MYGFLQYLLLASTAVIGPSIASVIQRQAVSVAVSSSPPAGWTYQGCYSDSVSNRVLARASYSNSTAMTEESCISFCGSMGYTVAGMEYAGECYCDYMLASSSIKEPDTDCSMACTGAPSEACGAGNRLTVFSTSSNGPSTNPGPSGWTFLGCYTDSTSARALSFAEAVPGGPSAVTVAQCTATCKQYGFQYAGMEYSVECYCGNSIQNSASPSSSGCTMTCSGNSSEFCGGPNRLNLYQQSSAIVSKPGSLNPGWSAVGCFTDNVSARTLSSGQGVIGGYTNMTIENCLSACQSSGYTLGGLEYSQECYCGNQLQNGGSCAADQTTCNMPCKGNSAEMCGGPNRLNMYQYGTGTVSTCPTIQTTTSTTFSLAVSTSTSSRVTSSTAYNSTSSTSSGSSLTATTIPVSSQSASVPTSTPLTTSYISSNTSVPTLISTSVAANTSTNSSMVVTTTSALSGNFTSTVASLGTVNSTSLSTLSSANTTSTSVATSVISTNSSIATAVPASTTITSAPLTTTTRSSSTTSSILTTTTVPTTTVVSTSTRTTSSTTTTSSLLNGNTCYTFGGSYCDGSVCFTLYCDSSGTVSGSFIKYSVTDFASCMNSCADLGRCQSASYSYKDSGCYLYDGGLSGLYYQAGSNLVAKR